MLGVIRMKVFMLNVLTPNEQWNSTLCIVPVEGSTENVNKIYKEKMKETVTVSNLIYL